jgi:hypothetical protein
MTTATTEKTRMTRRPEEPSANGHQPPAPAWDLTRWTLPQLGAVLEKMFTPTTNGSTIVLAFAPEGGDDPQAGVARQAAVAREARAAELAAARADLARHLDARDIPRLAGELSVTEKEAAVAQARLAQARAGVEVAAIDPTAAPGAAEALTAAEEAVKRTQNRRGSLRDDLARRRQELSEAAHEAAERAVRQTETSTRAELDALLATVASKISRELEALDAARRRGHPHPQLRAQAIGNLTAALVQEVEAAG